MYRVGLTGGVACGKTTVAAMFASFGAGVVDTDQVAREVVAPGSAAIAAIAAEFGASLVTASGGLDRAAMRRIVFNDTDRRKALERILHPPIRERTLARLAALESPYALVVVPLLFETDFHTLVDRTVVVDCAVETQLARLMGRDDIDENTARAMLAAQLEREVRLARADDVIDNGSGLDETRTQVHRLHGRYLELAGTRLPN